MKLKLHWDYWWILGCIMLTLILGLVSTYLHETLVEVEPPLKTKVNLIAIDEKVVSAHLSVKGDRVVLFDCENGIIKLNDTSIWCEFDEK